MMTIGKIIQIKRIASGMTQFDLAERIGCDTAQISRRERGQVPWLDFELTIVAKALHTTVSQLFKETESGRIDKRKIAWDGAYASMTPEEVDSALRFISPKKYKSKKST